MMVTKGIWYCPSYCLKRDSRGIFFPCSSSPTLALLAQGDTTSWPCLSLQLSLEFLIILREPVELLTQTATGRRTLEQPCFKCKRWEAYFLRFVQRTFLLPEPGLIIEFVNIPLVLYSTLAALSGTEKLPKVGFSTLAPVACGRFWAHACVPIVTDSWGQVGFYQKWGCSIWRGSSINKALMDGSILLLSIPCLSRTIKSQPPVHTESSLVRETLTGKLWSYWGQFVYAYVKLQVV